MWCPGQVGAPWTSCWGKLCVKRGDGLSCGSVERSVGRTGDTSGEARHLTQWLRPFIQSAPEQIQTFKAFLFCFACIVLILNDKHLIACSAVLDRSLRTLFLRLLQSSPRYLCSNQVCSQGWLPRPCRGSGQPALM